MKNYILLFTIVCCFFTSKAEQHITSSLFLSTNNELLASENKYNISKNYLLKDDNSNDKESKKAKRLKITGLVFTSLGAAGLLITTPFVVVYSIASGKNKFAGNIASAVVGVTGYIPSIACLAAGIPMTVVGFKKAKKLKQSNPKEF